MNVWMTHGFLQGVPSESIVLRIGSDLTCFGVGEVNHVR